VFIIFTSIQTSNFIAMLKIIFAGIFAIPCLLLTLCVAPLIALLAIPSLLLLRFRKKISGLSKNNPPDHVIIVGGSSGIGLCIAGECVKRGIGKITIMARNPDKLKQAKKELKKAADLQKMLDESKTPLAIQSISVSVYDFKGLEEAASELKLHKSDRVALFNCAGIPYTTEFEKIPPEECLKVIKTNQLGSMFIVKAFMPYLEHGVITLTSSVAAQAPVYGYAAYTPTKCAVRGFAECMSHELLISKPNLHLQVAYPADTKTPGYEEECKMMPPITKALNETVGLADPNE
jgi:3-dehydrosphinganine reductase